MEKEVSESERKLLVRKKYLTNISEIPQRTYIEQKELFTLIKNFFSEYLKLEYEFTYEELSKELNKIYIKQSLKNDIDNFLYDISETQYFTDKEMEQTDIQEYIQRLKSVVEQLIIEDLTIDHKKTSFFARIFGKPEEKKTDKEIASPKEEHQKTEDVKLPELKTAPLKESKEDKRDIEMENRAYRQKMFEDTENAEKIPSAPLSSDINIISDIPDLPKMPETVVKEKPALPAKTKRQAEKIKEEETQLQNFFVQKGYSLLVEDNNPEIVQVREHIEKAYGQISKNKHIIAKEAYLKALDTYHKLGFHEKEKVYQALYELFKELKSK